MKLLVQKDYRDILEGANLLGTGGGGTIAGGLSLIKKISKPIELLSLKELKSNETICTVFGVGGKENCDPLIASKTAMTVFEKILRKKISALIPVEAGAESIGTVLFIANELGIPVIDGDIVGLRSSPEIYLETITLANITRTPCVIADDKGTTEILKQEKNVTKVESFLRNFATKVGGDAFVAGYPMEAGKIKNVIAQCSITIAKETGRALEELRAGKLTLGSFCKKTGWKLIDIGKVVKKKSATQKGFIQGLYEIVAGYKIYTVVFKNENLVLLRNKKVILTCPDSISLLDLNRLEGVNNFEENRGKQVVILGKKAIPIWRTKEGKKLFSPKNLGFSYAQKLLS